MLRVDAMIVVIVHYHWLLLLMKSMRLRLPHKLVTDFLLLADLHFVGDYPVFKLPVPAREATVNMQPIQLVLRQQNKYLML